MASVERIKAGLAYRTKGRTQDSVTRHNLQLMRFINEYHRHLLDGWRLRLAFGGLFGPLTIWLPRFLVMSLVSLLLTSTKDT